LAHLAQFAARQGIALIDCQVESEHLVRLGAKLMARKDFNHQLSRLCPTPLTPHAWPAQQLCYSLKSCPR
jgi:leucyl/phenylalanyl-tRNA--protein transferase